MRYTEGAKSWSCERCLKFMKWAEKNIEKLEYEQAIEWVRNIYKNTGKDEDIADLLDNAFLNVFPYNSSIINEITK